MENFEKLKSSWKTDTAHSDLGPLDMAAWQNLLKGQVKKQKNIGMQYFWASLTYQIIVYGFLGHVMIRYGGDSGVLLPALLGMFLYVPFTVVLFLKFKRMAILAHNDQSASDLSIKEYVLEQHTLLSSFYRFKRRYEILLLPLSAAIFVWIFFRLFLPGGTMDYPIASSLLFILVLAACSAAILAENKRNFKGPLQKLEDILKDLNRRTVLMDTDAF
tara:strand:- start:2025 stop:2675 length:651 start_codon:yes stop_codon:yes gene_type:complete